MLNSELFDEVYEYVKGKKTTDILARKGSTALLIDSKLFSPKAGLRTYNECDYKKDVDRIVKAMRQTYLHAHDRFNHEYNPFTAEVEDVYALVVAYQDGYLDLGEIYKQIANALPIDEASEEYEWLCNHVGFTDVATFERFMLSSTDVIPEMMNRVAPTDKWLTGWAGSDLTAEVLSYQKKIVNDAETILYDIYGRHTI